MQCVRTSLCRKLAGRTLFITGASRGIGKAIALKAAGDGANIVVAAKTAEPHPKLPGTIYTAAKESKFWRERETKKWVSAGEGDSQTSDGFFVRDKKVDVSCIGMHHKEKKLS